MTGFEGDPPVAWGPLQKFEELWEEIKFKGDLGDFCKADLMSAIITYKQQKTPSATGASRKIEQVCAALDKIRGLLEELSEDEDFVVAGTDGYDGVDGPNWPIIAEWLEKSADLYEEMLKTDDRFKLFGPETMTVSTEAGDFKNEGLLTVVALEKLSSRPFTPLEALVHSVLVLQARFQRKPPPISKKDSVANPRFEHLVYLCAQAADSRLAARFPEERNDKIDRALDYVTRQFKAARDDDRDEWAVHWSLNLLSSE